MTCAQALGAESTADLTPILARVPLDSIERAVDEIRSGRPVVVLDDDSADSAGELVFAAGHADAALVSFAVRYTSGYLCVSVLDSDADRLDLPPMPSVRAQPDAPAFTVTVDASVGVSTGISAADRAHTIRLLADLHTRPADLSRPGHVLPVRAHRDGVLGRFGHTEASLDLARLAGLTPAGVLGELVSRRDPLLMAAGAELRGFADEFGLALISIADLVQHRRRLAPDVERMVLARVPLTQGSFNAVGYASRRDGREHVAFTYGEIGYGADLLVRVHNECLLGDVFGSQRCRCAEMLDESLAAVTEAGRGVVVYLRGRERADDFGAGLLAKLHAYQREDARLVVPPGQPGVSWDFDVAAQILDNLEVRSVRLLTTDPADASRLGRFGTKVVGTQSIGRDHYPEASDA
jgi:3,4-dihydroxy 2-butanone 4-phosphate synthase/GTP cyclohydrolase II